MTSRGWLILGVTALVAIGVIMWFPGMGIRRFAEAIAFAEGFGTPGAIPTERNNPGDLKLGSDSITAFSTVAEGWAALERQLRLIVSGASGVYSVTDTIAEMAVKYTGGDQPDAWANNVVSYLRANGVPNASVNTPLSAVLS